MPGEEAGGGGPELPVNLSDLPGSGGVGGESEQDGEEDGDERGFDGGCGVQGEGGNGERTRAGSRRDSEKAGFHGRGEAAEIQGVGHGDGGGRRRAEIRVPRLVGRVARSAEPNRGVVDTTAVADDNDGKKDVTCGWSARAGINRG